MSPRRPNERAAQLTIEQRTTLFFCAVSVGFTRAGCQVVGRIERDAAVLMAEAADTTGRTMGDDFVFRARSRVKKKSHHFAHIRSLRIQAEISNLRLVNVFSQTSHRKIKPRNSDLCSFCFSMIRSFRNQAWKIRLVSVPFFRYQVVENSRSNIRFVFRFSSIRSLNSSFKF